LLMCCTSRGQGGDMGNWDDEEASGYGLHLRSLSLASSDTQILVSKHRENWVRIGFCQIKKSEPRK
jgi:hypothetical protein